MSQVRLDLQNRSDADLLTFANAHIDSITGNTSFATPTPAPTAFATTVTAYATALSDAAAAQAAAQSAISAKDDARAALETALGSRGRYVEETSGGDETKILSAGFAVRAAAAPIGDLPGPENLRASFGDHGGEIDLMWDRVRGARSYVIDCRESTATTWAQAKMSTKSRVTVDGLTPGKTYFFRVRAVGAAGEGAFSDEATKMAP